ncbi:MAG: hypothetical protein CL918_01650 [Deltaproteobacteria bacterium]|nr:hypothetical protein [Deltaproteobacteria bacterium]
MIDESMWLSTDLPLELSFKLERITRLVDDLEEEEMRMVCKATMTHNFFLMHSYKQSLEKIAELEDNERPNRKTRKAPSKSGKVQE